MNEVIRVRAGVAVIQDGKIVLVPHYQTDPVAIRWYVPGGGVEFGESLHNAAVREFEEETGLSVRLEHLLDVSEVLEPERCKRQEDSGSVALGVDINPYITIAMCS